MESLYYMGVKCREIFMNLLSRDYLKNRTRGTETRASRKTRKEQIEEKRSTCRRVAQISQCKFPAVKNNVKNTWKLAWV